MDLSKAMKIAGSGMEVQSQRLRIIAENIANAETVSEVPGGNPYRRKVISFKNVLDQKINAYLVEVNRVGVDRSEFGRRLDASNRAADENGFVKLPNVKPLVEMMDMREAQRSYEANLSIIEVSKSMLQQTIQLLR